VAVADVVDATTVRIEAGGIGSLARSREHRKEMEAG
jgi:hypothetical protein